jgi:beta-N-acetylhexosaminidase
LQPTETPTTAASPVGEPETDPPAPPVDPAVALGAGAVVPWGPVTADDVGRAVTQVAGMTVAARAGSVVMAASGAVVGTSTMGDLGLGGVNLLGTRGVLDGTSNGRPAEVAEVTAALAAQLPADQAGFPLLIATDQENGDVTRMVNGFTELPGAGDLGSIDDLDAAVRATRETAAISAAELAAVGINLDFAPVSDLLPLRGSSGIADRSFGSDPDRTAALVAAAVQGYQNAGVAASLKHFPGLGEVAADSHVTLATLEADCDAWNARASVPVRAGVAAGVGMVMTGHTLFPAVDDGSEPTSLSRVILQDLLRGDPAVALPSGCTPVGFRGLAISDSVVMAPVADNYSTGEAAWRSLAAGEDIVLMPASPAAAVAGITDAVATGQLAETRLNEASVRVFALRSALSRSVRPPLDVVGSGANEAAAQAIWNQIR